MRKPKIHNRICRSIFIVPVCMLLTVVLWWWPQMAYSHGSTAALLLVLLTSMILMEIGNTYQLIRVRSRMMVSVWLFWTAFTPALHTWDPGWLAVPCLAYSHYLLFRTYQRPQSVGLIFHVFAVFSLGCIALPHLTWMSFFFLWYLVVFMRAMSFRGLLAALLGMALPFWLWTGWLLSTEDFGPLIAWYTRLVDIHMGGMVAFLHPTPLIYAFIFLAFLTLWLSGYYLLNSFDDKIRTRMMMYIYVFQSVLLVSYGACVDVATAYPLLLLCLSPLAAHYFVLRETWLSLFVFVTVILSFIGFSLSVSPQ